MHRFSGAVLSFILLATPVAVVAHGGHGDEFHSHDAQFADSIQVDAETAQRIGLKVEPVMLRRLAFGIKATGQIEALPSRRVEVTYPVGGTIVRLFVQPGDRVKQGQPVAVITSAELAELRVNALDRQAEMSGEVEKAKADLLLAQQKPFANWETRLQAMVVWVGLIAMASRNWSMTAGGNSTVNRFGIWLRSKTRK
ncbi:biotin/lipoyl-binding protein [Leptolyngbya sp. 7M]|uniref:biotin/lipoyl-binding protein n=1 Tax=Leptolyngbya sp. 7M TaxID=2812896 RepID=UPI001B8C6D7E|nr:biotin/lipoyl-binding protein [Leptolyngbya sp. 7M]QYO63019.1 biotin/lipoyl-binding protein [Leptolyngbya sp. 7M]